MVYRKPDPLCISQYRGFYNASAAVCNDRSRWLFHMFSALADLFTGEILYRFIGSVVMMSLGIIGYYIARIYEEVKRRPRYIVSRIIHGGHENEKTDS